MNLLSPLVSHRKKHRLSSRLVLYVVLCSSFFALMATASQLYMDYRRDVSTIETNLQFIKDSYVPAITSSLFSMDEEQLEILLQGALRLSDVKYLTVDEHVGDTAYRLSRGDPVADQDIVRIHQLDYRLASGEKVPGGTLTVVASLDGVYERLWARIFVVLVTNAVKTFMAAFCILLIIQFLVTRHLTTMASYAEQLDLDTLGSRLVLHRGRWKSSEPDELDQVVMAVNDMQERMRSDMAKRETAEEALRKSEEKYRFVTENATDVLWQSDMEGNLTFVSPSFEVLTGYTVEEGMGMKIWDLLTPESGDDVTKLLKRSRGPDHEVRESVGKPVMAELECRHRDGGLIHCELTARFVRDEQNRPVGITGVTRDVSEKKRMASQLQQTQKIEAIGTLAGGIAHDFNNILGAIMGYAELAQLDTPEGTPVKTNLELVLKSASRAKDLVQQILTFSRQGEQEERPIEVAPIIKEGLKMLRASIPATIEIRQHIPKELLAVVVDPTQIHQVLINLSTNAAHAMRKKGGILEISLESVDLNGEAVSQHPTLEPGTYVKLTVSDTGHGMSESVKKRIFDPYFTTKEKGVGTGLGLAVVHGIVKGHGGEVRVESQPGLGTTFEVLLPRVATAPSELSDALETLDKGDECVLIVDDEQVLVDIGRQMLEHLGYRCVAKTSAMEALRAFGADPNKFDLVITDQTMPSMTGDRLAKQLLGIRPDIPIILCTGYSELITEDDARERGIREFVMKPLTLSDLARTVRKVLDND